jgi:serine/threonine protein kinase
MDKTHLHIFQEWIPGGSVACLLSKFGPFSLQVIRSYLRQTLSGLIYLHDNDIMHRDIKGSNILVNDDGVVKLADFGASKKLANLHENLMMSLTVRGTPYFMAPEVFEEKYSAKADIWGVGCVAFQMATGNPPWKDKGFTNPISLFNHIQKHEGPPTMDFASDEQLSNQDKKVRQLFDAFVRTCFQKDPSVRPTARELLDDPFFIEMHEEGDDDERTHYRGLFSPGNETITSWDSARSPEMPSQAANTPSPQHVPSPSSQSHSRSKSVIQWKSSFLSPPRPKRNTERSSPSPLRASPQAVSPKPDSSEWPDWARSQLKRKSLLEKSPSSRRNEPNISELMGSLALSEDTASVSQNPFRRTSQGRTSTIGSTGNSNLVGLHFLDKSNSTYEL